MDQITVFVVFFPLKLQLVHVSENYQYKPRKYFTEILSIESKILKFRDTNIC